MTRAAALSLLGLSWHDLPPMNLRILDAIRRANRDLLESFKG